MVQPQSGWLGRRLRRPLTIVAIIAFGLSSQLSIARAEPFSDVHVVQPGETLSEIALNFGIGLEALAAGNQISNPDTIVIGQRLSIPSANGDSPATETAAVSSEAVEYTIQPGDSLSSIAAGFGVAEGLLARVNQIEDPDLIQIGEVLTIPAQDSGPTSRSARPAPAAAPANPGGQTATHVVAPGDTMFSISSAFGVPIAELISFNGIDNPDLIQIGQSLSIPGAGSSAPAPVAASAPAPAPPPAPAPSSGSWTNAEVTYYCLQGRMNNGNYVHEGAAATDHSVYPLGTVIEVEGIGTFTVEDRFGKDLGQQRIDLWTPDCGFAINWGIRYRQIRVVGP